MKKWVLVGILVGAVGSGAAFAQVKAGMGAPGKKMPQSGQGLVSPAPDVPTVETVLGTVRIPRGVMADGKALAAGTYQVRLTAQEAKPDVVGQTPKYERWVEFVRGGQARAREVVSIVPPSEIDKVAEDVPPGPGGSKVQMLAGNDYVRVWFNRNGTHYLIHLPVGGGAR
ncbi:MAG: hypothetical protein HYX76_00480 [Acidobacteria bacterium]|nr:hypothetical protein [Acidobacteriota bacterium]